MRRTSNSLLYYYFEYTQGDIKCIILFLSFFIEIWACENFQSINHLLRLCDLRLCFVMESVMVEKSVTQQHNKLIKFEMKYH